MSLRGQFLLSVVLALLLGFAVDMAIAGRQAESSVENEMRRALATSGGFVSDALASLPATGRQTYLLRLVRGFDGDRHIRLALAAQGRVIATSRPAPPEEVPAWFVRMLSIASETRTTLVAGGDVLTLATDPHNEISENWAQLCDSVMALMILGGLILLLLSLAMARLVRPLKWLSAGFDAVGGGDYAARVRPDGPSEFSYIANAFNRMAERLGVLEASNRRLSGQILAIQEEERADLARDLHDEMGPLLLSVRVDAAGIAAMAPDSPVALRAHAIGDVAARMQVYVREILKQLRPDEDADLRQALENLALFWRTHHGNIDVRLAAMPLQRSFGPDVDAAIFRLVQEGLTNAVRHGGARNICVTVTAIAENLLVRIEDDGTGFGAAPAEGLGLKGMRERLSAFSGRLSLTVRPGGGACLTAELTCHAPAQQELA